MTRAQRILSLFILSGMTLAVVPLASAADTEVPDWPTVREQIRACLDVDSFEAHRECMQDVMPARGRGEGMGVMGMGMKMPRGAMHNLTDEQQEQLDACRDLEDANARRECAQPILEEARAAQDAIRDQIHEQCGDVEDRDEQRECIQEFREENDLPALGGGHGRGRGFGFGFGRR